MTNEEFCDTVQELAAVLRKRSGGTIPPVVMFAWLDERGTIWVSTANHNHDTDLSRAFAESIANRMRDDPTGPKVITPTSSKKLDG